MYKFIDAYAQFMHLSIFVDSPDEKLKSLYVEQAHAHNAKIVETPEFYNAGFSVLLPPPQEDRDTNIFYIGHGTKVEFHIKCCAKICDSVQPVKHRIRHTPFYVYAHPDLPKTPLRVSTNPEIVQAGCRESLSSAFDCIAMYIPDNVIQGCELMEEGCYVDNYVKMMQICAPGLIPIYVTITDTDPTGL